MKAVNYEQLTQPQRREIREQYVAFQSNKCYHCKGDLSVKPRDIMKRYPINKSLFPNHFLRYPVHLHHDHDSGMTIGAVHAYCNAVLWEYYNE